MRTQIKVTDLSLSQWDYITTKVEVNHEFKRGEVRTCVQFELTEDIDVIHTELPVTDVAGLLTVLKGIETQDVARAALGPDALPGRLEAIRNEADPSRAREQADREAGSRAGTGPVAELAADLTDVLDRYGMPSGTDGPDDRTAETWGRADQ